MQEIRQVVYVSTAWPKLSRDQLEALLVNARAKNEQLGVTGLLVYGDGSIMQTVEGPPDVVESLLTTIRNDPRHKDVTIIIDRTIETRDFPEWRMAFAQEATSDTIAGCLNLLRSREALKSEVSTKSGVGTVMADFIERARY